MSQNLFTKTMSGKTEEELKAVLAENSPYVEEARQAAVRELEKRNVKSEETVNLDAEPSKAKPESLEDQYEPVFNKNKKYITDDPDAPELYTKTAITLFSALFSTIFGAALLMSNMKTMGKNSSRFLVLAFGVIYTAIIIFTNEKIGTHSSMVTVFNLIGAAILTEIFWNHQLGKKLKHRKKKIWKPLIISIIVTIPFLLAIIYG